jgi:hypothetical protein
MSDDIRSSSFWERYDQFGSPRSNIGITFQAFQTVRLANPSRDVEARTMLTSYEISLLYALARDYYRGQGLIVDLGVLNGVSTNALAKGLRGNTQVADKRKRIFSFDLFHTQGLPEFMFGGRPDITGCFLDSFLENNRDFLDLVSVNAGDLRHLRWNPQHRIEILFNNVSKSCDLSAWTLEHLFPALLPGVSVVVQQDYIYFHSYWVAITMERWREHFEPLYPVFGSSMAYRYTREIPRAELREDLRALPFATHVELLDRAIAAAMPSVKEVLKCAKAYCQLHNGRTKEAHATLATVDLEEHGGDPLYDFSGIARSNHSIVKSMLARHEHAHPA